MVSFTFHRRSTCVFFKRYIEESFSRNAHRNYSPFGGKYGIWQSCLSAYQNDSRYLYFDSDFSCLSFPECLRLFILTVVERYKKKPTRSARLKPPSCIYKRITLSSLEASIFRPFIQRTRSNNLS